MPGYKYFFYVLEYQEKDQINFDLKWIALLYENHPSIDYLPKHNENRDQTSLQMPVRSPQMPVTSLPCVPIPDTAFYSCQYLG
ncbi:hypothetical protein D3C87_1271780 [compost metagenome]